MRKLVFLFLFLLLPMQAWGQAGVPGTLTQQSPTKLDAATSFATAVTTGAVITINPPGGMFVYITGVEISNCAFGTVTPATATFVTSTGLGGGTTPVWSIGSGATSGLCQPSPVGIWTAPLKSNSAGTAVTFTLPTFVTNQVLRVSVYYYFAP